MDIHTCTGKGVIIIIIFKANISYMYVPNYLVELTGGLQIQVPHDMQVPLILPPHSSSSNLKKKNQ